MGCSRRSAIAGAHALLEIFDRQRALVEELLHQIVVTFRDELDERFVRCLRLLRELFGNRANFGLPIAIGRILVRFHRHEIDDAVELAIGPDRQLHGNGAAPERFLHGLHGALVTGQLAIHAVHDERARQVILVRVIPDGSP